MRPAISADPETGTTRQQMDDEIGRDDLAHDISFAELLGVTRSAYERIDIKKSPAVKVEAPMAEVSWQQARATADVLRDASEFAFQLEMRRRGYTLASKILSGKYHSSGKHKHKTKSQKRGQTHATEQNHI